MTLKQAKDDYEALLSKEPTHKELVDALRELKKTCGREWAVSYRPARDVKDDMDPYP